MKILTHVLGALALLGSVSSVAMADEPCDAPTYQVAPARTVRPVYDRYDQYDARYDGYRPTPVVIRREPYRYGWYRPWVEARRAEERREAYRHARWHSYHSDRRY